MCSTRPAQTLFVCAGRWLITTSYLQKELDYRHPEERLYQRALQTCG